MPVLVSGVAPILAAPNAVALSAVAQTQPVLVSEAGYTGAFAAVSADTTVATVSPAGSGGAFTITSVGHGSTAITFSNVGGSTLAVPVTVTTGTGSVN